MVFGQTERRRPGPEIRSGACRTGQPTCPASPIRTLPAEKTLRLTRGILEALFPASAPARRADPGAARGPRPRPAEAISGGAGKRVDSDRLWRRSGNRSSRRLAIGRPLGGRGSVVLAVGVPVGLCVTPTLPLEDPVKFADRLTAAAPAVLVVQNFHSAGGKFGADTGKAKPWKLVQDFLRGSGEVVQPLRRIGLRPLPRPLEGEAGFFPADAILFVIEVAGFSGRPKPPKSPSSSH